VIWNAADCEVLLIRRSLDLYWYATRGRKAQQLGFE